CPRRNPVRTAYRPTALPGCYGVGDPETGALEGTGATTPPGARRAAHLGGHLPQVFGERATAALCQRERVGRRPASFPAGSANTRAAAAVGAMAHAAVEATSHPIVVDGSPAWPAGGSICYSGTRGQSRPGRRPFLGGCSSRWFGDSSRRKEGVVGES